LRFYMMASIQAIQGRMAPVLSVARLTSCLPGNYTAQGQAKTCP